MTMTGLLLACLTGLGLLLVYDGLTRPTSRRLDLAPGRLPVLVEGR